MSVTKTMLKLSLRRKAGNTGENKLEGPDCVLPACRLLSCIADACGASCWLCCGRTAQAGMARFKDVCSGCVSALLPLLSTLLPCSRCCPSVLLCRWQFEQAGGHCGGSQQQRAGGSDTIRRRQSIPCAASLGKPRVCVRYSVCCAALLVRCLAPLTGASSN